MVKVRTATVASMVVLLSTTLGAALAQDTWGDAAQYNDGASVTQQQQSTDAPATWEASKKSDDSEKDTEDKKSDKSDDKTDAPSSSWTPAPSTEGSGKDASNSWKQGSGNYWSQGPTPSWGSSKKSDNTDDDNQSDTSSTEAPATSEKGGKSDDDNNDVGSSKSSKTSESNDESWKQEPITFSSVGSRTSETSASSTGSETSETPTSSTGSQTTGTGGGSTTPSTKGGSVPDGTWPTSTGSVKLTAPQVIKAGEVFDGKMQTFDRSDITCTGGEGQKDTAVFLVEAGGTLKNAIIGKNQKEGVHCDDHDCTIENVWWDDVCEDALSIKGGTASSVTTVTNCGAKSASDKVVQHNGQGTVNIDGFYAEEFGKLYRSCGTCGDIPRTVTLKNVYAVNPLVSVVTVNKNYGDKATLSNIWVKTSNGKDDVKVCQWSEGSKDPKNVGDGPSPPLCQYTDSDIHINQDISKAGASGPSKPSTPTTPSDGSSTSQTQSTEAPTTPSESNDDDVAGSEDAGSDDTGSYDTNAGIPAVSSAGSQTSWSSTPTTSTESSETDEGSDATSLAGSETSETPTSATGSQTTGTGGGSTTPSTSGGSVPDGTWPTSAGTVQFAEARIIKAGEVFDGKMKTYERSGVSCEGQTESGADTAVFKMEPGSTLKNVIIGKNQMEGVHCDKHDCTIENVWWDDVCEDALSVKGGTASSVTTVTGGGARSADDKVIQHNGFGTVKIDSFYGEDISKLYRSCGTCGNKQRKVDVSNVYIVNPDNAVVTVNKNWKDEATLSNIWVKSAGKKKVKICQWSQGNADGEPSMLGDGPSPPLCQYSESDIHLNQDVSKAGGSTPATPSTPSTPSEGSTLEELPGTVSPDSPTESSGNDDEGNTPSQQTQESTASSTEGSVDGGDDNADTTTWSQAASKSTDENNGGGDEEQNTSSKSSNGDNNNQDKDKDTSIASKGDDKSEKKESGSKQEQEVSSDESVMQSEIGGEADPTAVKSEAATKESMYTSTATTSTSKCNIRRRRN